MNKILKLLMLASVAILILAGCGQAAPAAPPEAVVVAPAVVEVTVVEAGAATAVEKVVEEITTELAGAAESAKVEVDLTDLSYVANTGRPQFLNSYADW